MKGEISADTGSLQVLVDIRMSDDEDVLLALDDLGCAEDFVRVAVHHGFDRLDR